jgi:hypothetical protein
MGHVGSAIASRLGYNKKWKLSWVMSGNNYKSSLQKDLLLLRAVKNALNNYGNPDFSFDLRRNNKEEDSNKKSGDEGILKNPFVSKSLTHSHTRIARGLFLTVSTYVMDSHLDGWRIKYTRNFKKIPSILFKPVIRNRRKPRLLLWFKKKRKTVNKVSSRKSKKLRKKKKIFVPPKAIRNKFRLSKKNKQSAELFKLKKKPGYKIVAKKKKDSFIVGDKKTTGAFFKKVLKRFLKVTQNTNPKKNLIKTTFKQKFKLKRYKYKYKSVATREVYDDSEITEPVVENTINSRRLNKTYLNYIEKKLLVTKKINLFSVLLFDVVYSAITSLPKRLFNFITGCFKHGVLLYNNVKKKCLVYTMIIVVSLVLFHFATEHKVTTSKQKIIIMENTTNMESFATRKPEVKVANNQTFKILVEDNNHLPEHGKNKRFIKLYRRYKSYWDNFCSNSGGVFKKLSPKLSPKNAFSKIITYFNDSVYNSKKKALKKKMKRYPLFFFQWLLKYRYSFLLPPSTNRFTVFKALILGFRWIIRHSKKVHFFFLTIFRSLLLSLFLLPGFIPRFFMIKMLSLLILKEFSYRHLNSYFFNKIFNTRFIVFQTTYAALSSTIQSFDSFTRFSYNFFGMHTRNVTPSLVVNYICHKLGQYFQINQIIGPVIQHLKRLRSLRGFCLKIFGRLTRKERAAVIIRKFRRVTLAKKSADIEHASQSKALRFGMSGVSAWFMLKDEGAKPMAYNFSMTLTLLLVILQKTPLKIEKRFMFPAAKRFTDATNNALFRGQPVLYQREMTTWVGAYRKIAKKMPYPPTTYADDGLPNHNTIYCSGEHHVLMPNLDSLKNNKVLVYPSITSNKKSFANFEVMSVGRPNYMGEDKAQNALIFSSGRWSNLDDLELSIPCQKAMAERPEFWDFLRRLAAKNKLDPNIKIPGVDTATERLKNATKNDV